MNDQPNDQQLHAMRHSLAHIMATAITHLYPGVKLGVGPVVENGFYYDIDLGDQALSDEDFPKIEAEMKKVIGADQPFEHFTKPIDDAIAWADDAQQPYKKELLHDLKRAGTTVVKDLDAEELGVDAQGDSQVDEVSFYKNGDFVDLCRGPHVSSTGKVGAFKLMRVSGAYWRGKDTNPQMQRIYGLAFATEADLRAHLELLEEAKKRDHRRLGEELKLFFISDSVGAGLPLFMPRGEIVRRQLMDYMREKEEAHGYQYVSSPVLTQAQLYERSGHASYYLENMYATKPDEEGNIFYLKPMNCPHHHMIYEKMVNSYRDLPLRLAEHAGVYRYELSGTLTGLIRMRGPITQNDSHTYVTPEQVEQEFTEVLQLFEEVYLETGVKDYWFRLSLPDFSKEKYAGNKDQWEWAGNVIRDCLKKTKAKFVEELDEAAFYGPKVDIQTRNVLGKEDSIATVQLDIVVPERMGLTYIDNDGKEQTPLVIHKSIMGCFERFMAFLLEQTAGKLPVWLSPEQVRILPLNNDQTIVDFASKVAEQAKVLGLRVSLDNDNESVGKRIRSSELMKVPYTLVIGPKEIETGQVTPRIRKDMEVSDEHQQHTVEEFLKTVANEAKSRVNKTSL
ncbi:MAG TPA: threonine--tRNA ligase [Candidatus Saccharimonadales bacterium]|nr:threonine--tRNA ligase [Candidatus Saccharimonadales bacterium]